MANPLRTDKQKQVLQSISDSPDKFLNVTTAAGGRKTIRRSTGETAAKGFSRGVETEPRNPASVTRLKKLKGRK